MLAFLRPPSFLHSPLGHDWAAGLEGVSLVDHVEAADEDVAFELGCALQRPDRPSNLGLERERKREKKENSQ
jgi:hypothetical protein